MCTHIIIRKNAYIYFPTIKYMFYNLLVFITSVRSQLTFLKDTFYFFGIIISIALRKPSLH